MKKQIIIIIFLLTFIEIANLSIFARAFYYNLNYFNTDKQEYFVDEKIKINASWGLDYNPGNEISYIQIHIYDYLDNLLWNTSKYRGIGSFQENWTVRILDLDCSFTNYSTLFYVKFYYYFFRISDGFTVSGFVDTIEIKAIKKNTSCELIGFKDHLEYGESTCFKARFYDNINSSNLINQIILFEVILDSLTLYRKNFTTDSGIIEIKLSTLIHLESGRYLLRFILSNNHIYNNSKFEYELIVNDVNESLNVEGENIEQLNLIPFFSLLFVLLGLFTVIVYNSQKKRGRQMRFSESTIKY